MEHTLEKKTKIFISWSKPKSKEIAILTKKLLAEICPDITTFVSEVDIIGGSDVQKEIINQINHCDKLVLCFTKENKKSPWLLFEAGFARGLDKTVIPILFDEDPGWQSWIDNPINVLREIRFNRCDFNQAFIAALELDIIYSTNKAWQSYRDSILDIQNRYRVIDAECEDIVEKLIHNEVFVLKSPYFIENKGVFLTGFETHDFYKAIIDSFLYTGKYFWVYGRKNHKLFDKSYELFFNYLKNKTSQNPLMEGIDFRCLFLNPTSDEVRNAHANQDSFTLELNSSLSRAKNIVGDNKHLQKCLKFYSNKRECIIIRIDECIIYSKPIFDRHGRPQKLTNTGFEVFSTNSEKGQNCLTMFEEVWAKAESIPDSFGVEY